MRSVTLLCEDSFHERFLSAMIGRLAAEESAVISLKVFSASGGHSRVAGELKALLRRLRTGESPPDCIVVAVDGNSFGRQARAADLSGHAPPEFADLLVYAIPEPEIERWMLLDSVAFQRVFGKGCNPPRAAKGVDYKRELRRQIRECGIEAPLGGLEYAEDIVNEIDWHRASAEPSFHLFLREFRSRLRRWSRAE